MNHNYVVIMAGGVGSRFWPASREEKPKQFLDMLGLGKSLLRHTYERFTQITDPSKIYVVTNERYRDLVKEHIPEISHKQILGEPSRNNTAPCVAYASLKLYDLDPEANLVVAPSDHFIAQEQDFLQVIHKSLEFVASGEFILTLGMRPHRPDTGYGYIELGDALSGTSAIHETIAFKEKPDEDTAKKYLEAGNFVWNSGIFLFSAKTIMQAFSRHAEDIFSILIQGSGAYNTDAEQEFLQTHYPSTPNISIDYAIMEKADNMYCYPADFGWTDLGTWGSLYDFVGKDNQGNVAIGGKVIPITAKGNLMKLSSGRKVVLHEVHRLLIVEERDIILITPLDKADEVKKIRNQLAKED